jgi:Secretion system C-terminal sorting domain
MKKILIIFIIIGLCKSAQAQCPPGASGFEVANPSCSGGCAVLLTGWPAGVIVNIFSASPLDSIGTSGVISSSGSAFVCIPCHTDIIFASYVPGATNGCVILVGTLLSVTLNNFTVTQLSKGSAILKWDVSSETGDVAYTVQRSADGKVFNDISTINGDANGQVLKSYSYSDEDAGQGIIYYRLKITDGSGSLKYSSIVSINSQAGPGIKIFPNPITGNSFTLSIAADLLPALITISDAQGRTVYSNQTFQVSLTINTPLSSGIYSLKVIGNNNTTAIQKIIRK